ncbi:MAG: insulinase family protein [Ruminococcaceae bacterium]|nr:insulinase family protein [Oscillospiraceae bacterium]
MKTKKETYVIKPGVRLHHIQTNQFKTVTVGLHFHRQLTAKEASLNALLTDVIRRGNKQYTDSATLGRYLQTLYGAYFDADIRRKGEDQILSFTISTVADRFIPGGDTCVQKSVALLFDMVFQPQVENSAFRSDYVEQEKKNLINDIEALINDKRSYAQWRLIENMCEGESYAVHELGDVESVRAITPESLYAQYHKVISESPVDVFVTGEADIDAICKLVTERFSTITPLEAYPVTDLYIPKEGVRRIEESFDVSQAKLSMGFYTGVKPTDARYPSLMVYNSILGSGAHSKLFNNVREKLSLAYYAASRLYRYKGLMVIASGIEYANRQKAEDEIFVQIEDMKQGNISAYEFDVSVKSIINSLRSLGDDNGYLEDYYLGQSVSGTNVSIQEQCEKIQAVTMDDVVKVAQVIKPEMVYVMKGKKEA